MASPALRCSDLWVRYPGRPPVEAVRGLSLEVRPGECFGLLGPNGAGKTSTIEVLEGLQAPSAGEVEVLGLRWQRDDDEIRQRIGISLQETRLPDRLSVRETLTLFRSFYRRGIDAEEAMRQVSLEDKATAWVVKLSGGQRQRLAVACALVGAPELLFLDEPTTGLDPQARRSLWELVRGLLAQGRTVIITTHYMDEAERLCDRVAVVDRGQVISSGSPADLIGQLGADQLIELSLAGEQAAVDPAQLAELPTVKSARQPQPGSYSLAVGELHLALPALLARLGELGCRLTSLSTRRATLEDVFVSLTGRHLDEAQEAQR
jgi:ABC-2 type transport system ATP-binding protein